MARRAKPTASGKATRSCGPAWSSARATTVARLRNVDRSVAPETDGHRRWLAFGSDACLHPRRGLSWLPRKSPPADPIFCHGTHIASTNSSLAEQGDRLGDPNFANVVLGRLPQGRHRSALHGGSRRVRLESLDRGDVSGSWRPSHDRAQGKRTSENANTCPFAGRGLRPDWTPESPTSQRDSGTHTERRWSHRSGARSRSRVSPLRIRGGHESTRLHPTVSPGCLLTAEVYCNVTFYHFM